MATPSLTDQERAILAQFVASSTSDPGNAPILIQYALDRKAREPNSTMAEIVSALSPNGIDAGVDYGPYLDAVNRTLGPASENPALAYSGQQDGSSVFDWTPFETSTPIFRSSPATAPVDTTMDPNNPNTPDWANLDAIGAAENSPYHQWTHPNEVRPAPVQVADIQQPFSTFDVPAPATSVPFPRSRPAAPVESQPIAAPAVRNPISDVRLPPATPQFTTPPRSTAIAPTGPLQDNVPGPNGVNVAKDQTRLTDAPTSPELAFAEPANVTREGLNIRPVQTVSIDPRTGMPFSDSAPIPVRTPTQAATGMTYPAASPSVAATGMTYPAAVNPPAPIPTIDPPLLAALEAVARQAAIGSPRVDPRREVAQGQQTQLDDRLALADEQQKSAGIPWNSDMAQDPLAAQALATIADRNAPRSITKTADVGAKNGPATTGLQLSDNDRELLARAVATEVDPRIARTNPEAYALQAQHIIDTIVNRVASPEFPDTVAGVLNQRGAFSAINGPLPDAYGAVENIPAARADTTLRNIVSSYLDGRVAGTTPSSVRGAVNFGNPNAVDAANLDWVNGLNYAVDDAGPFSHRYGVAQGNTPFEATFTNPALDAANALAGGSLGTMMPSRLTNTGKEDSKQIKVSAAPIDETWTSSAFAPAKSISNAPKVAQQKNAPAPTDRTVAPASWTQPASSNVNSALAAAATKAANTTKAATAKVPNAPSLSSGGGGWSGGSVGGAPISSSSSRSTPTSTTSVGTKTSTTSTVGSSKTATTSKNSPTTSSSTSTKTSTSSASSSKTSNSSSSSDKSSSKNR